MAQPLEPKFASSPAAEPPPVPQKQANGENAIHSPHPSSNGFLHAKPAFDPWPTTDTPFSPADGKTPAAVPTRDWEEPLPAPMPSYGGYSEDGYFILKPEEKTEPSGQKSGDDVSAAAPGSDEWEEDTRKLEQEIRMDLADSAPLFPGRRSLYKRSEPPPSADEQLENVIDFLQKLQKNVRRVVPETEETSPAALGSTLLQLRRLSRTGVAPDPFEIGVLPKPPKLESAPPVQASPEPRAKESTEPKESPLSLPEPIRLQRRHVVWLILTGGLCFITLGLVAYLWTRVGSLPHANGPARRGPAAHTAAPGSTPDQEVSEEALSTANLALEAMQRGDLKAASDLLTGAQRKGVILPGLFYQAALLALNQGRAQEADDLLERSIQANEAVPDCWYLRANTIFFTEGPAQAAEAFEQAIAAAPFSPRSYFFRAECLRRNGKAAEAVGQFQQALRCRPNSTDTELILFKIGLTKIETNTDLIFKTELHNHLAQEPVSGDMLLLAAADAITRREFVEAAGFLKRAALVLPPRVFQSRLRDYVYQAQVKQPDIAAVLKLTLTAASPGSQPPNPRAGRMLIDPATRNLAEADPGGW